MAPMNRAILILKSATLLLFLICLFASAAISNRSSQESRSTFQPSIPQGIPPDLWRKLIPEDNPVMAEKVALGKLLFFDKQLSVDSTVSCATCHDPATAFADHNAVAVGIKQGARNAPSLLNAVFNPLLFRDGRARALEDQAIEPLTSPFEMGMKNHQAIITRVSAISDYRKRFRKAFPKEGITIETIVKAIAAFERTLLSGNSPFDQYRAGNNEALTADQKRGWELFRGKARCISCHQFTDASPFFTDFSFHNTGIAAKNQNLVELLRIEEGSRDQMSPHHSALGRFIVTRKNADAGAFKTPSLRDVELTAPYMHDGSEKTLIDVVRFYNRGGQPNPYLDPRMQRLELTDEEVSCIVEFLKSLTSADVLRQSQNTKPQTRGV
jgi:cytochrome c peroxidase